MHCRQGGNIMEIVNKFSEALPLQEVLKQWFEVNPHEIVICQEDGWYMSPSSFKLIGDMNFIPPIFF